MLQLEEQPREGAPRLETNQDRSSTPAKNGRPPERSGCWRLTLASGANCLTTCNLFCLLGCHKCRLDVLASRIAFVPPVPSTYSLELKQGVAQGDPWRYKLKLRPPQLKQDPFFSLAARRMQVRLAAKPDGRKITIGRMMPSAVQHGLPMHPTWEHLPAVLGESCLGANPDYGILFAHGNAADIGVSSVSCLQLAEQLRMRVYAVDYTGYGGAGLEVN